MPVALTSSLLTGVYWAFHSPQANTTLLPGAVAFGSICSSVVALPHVVVGSFFDTGRGIWYVP